MASSATPPIHPGAPPLRPRGRARPVGVELSWLDPPPTRARLVADGSGMAGRVPGGLGERRSTSGACFEIRVTTTRSAVAEFDIRAARSPPGQL